MVPKMHACCHGCNASAAAAAAFFFFGIPIYVCGSYVGFVLVATLSYGIVAFALRCSLTSQLPARVCGSFDELSLMFVCFLISAEYSIEYIY